MFDDRTPLIATAGFIGTFTLAEINQFVGILVGLATLGYVISKWVRLLRSPRAPFPPRDRSPD